MKDNKENEVQLLEEARILEEHRDSLTMDALLRLTALENLLIRAKLITPEELTAEILSLSSVIAKTVSEKVSTQLKESNNLEIERWAQEFSVVTKAKDRGNN